MTDKGELVHGTAVAIGAAAVLLRGPSGSGKSDLALRMLRLWPVKEDAEACFQLVGDDQLLVSKENGRLTVRGPETLAGLIEVRGLGILNVPCMEKAELCLVADLVASSKVERMPPSPLPEARFHGVGVPRFEFAPFEASAPQKIYLAMTRLVGIAQ